MVGPGLSAPAPGPKNITAPSLRGADTGHGPRAAVASRAMGDESGQARSPSLARHRTHTVDDPHH
jgi:hypothetical protein